MQPRRQRLQGMDFVRRSWCRVAPLPEGVKPSSVNSYTLADIEQAFRDSWALDTCDPVDAALWSERNPARGQCGVTSMTLQDLIGGDLLEAEVLFPDGSHQGYHYWNRLAGGIEIDLTLEQFDAGEVVRSPRVIQRLTPLPTRLAEEYVLLRTRVYDRLGLSPLD